MRARRDRGIVAIARRQHGVVTVAQLHALGTGRHAIEHRLRHGWLRRVHRGVFVVGPLEGRMTTVTAAVLAVGDGAVLGGRTPRSCGGS